MTVLARWVSSPAVQTSKTSMPSTPPSPAVLMTAAPPSVPAYNMGYPWESFPISFTELICLDGMSPPSRHSRNSILPWPVGPQAHAPLLVAAKMSVPSLVMSLNSHGSLFQPGMFVSSWSQDAPSQMAIPPFDCAPVLATLDPTTRSPP